jgi:hypothetical protein
MPRQRHRTSPRRPDCTAPDLLSGYLIFRSTFLPRFLGVLLALAGICYLVNTLVALMPKGFGEFLFPWIFLPILVGEGVLALWLLIVGINSAKWDAIAKVAIMCRE